jgi:hypothetical protein
MAPEAPDLETKMNANPNSNLSDSRIAAGIKAAALLAIVGLVAVVAQPTRMPDETFHAQAVTTQAPATDTGDYFPSHYPAPTTPSEQAPTF